MKKIVITIELKKSIPKGERKHVIKNVDNYVAAHHITFVEGLEDSISCDPGLENIEGVKQVTITLKK